MNLREAAGVRLIGAGAGSVLQRSNIVDNSYGVFNVGLDGLTPATGTSQVKAENNWWGLRGSANPTNTGPAISPTTNPPTPENPVNGAPVEDGTARPRSTPTPSTSARSATACSRTRTRASSRSSTCPARSTTSRRRVTIATDKFTYKHGEKVTLTAAPDRRLRRQARSTFYDGAWLRRRRQQEALQGHVQDPAAT